MSQIVQILQGSAEWHAYRRGMRNASESGAVLGVSPWTTLYQLWLLKTGRAEQASTAAMQHGTAMEPLARHAYEVETGQVMQPLVLQEGPYSASLDGITLDGDLLLEIKCPVRGHASVLWREVTDGTVPAHYMAQVQHQLMVSGAVRAHLWVFDGERGLLREIHRDEAAMQGIRTAWDRFAEHLDTDSPPPLVDRDIRVRDDEPWIAAAAAYALAKRDSDRVADQLEAAKRNLLALASHPRESGSGVTVTRYWKQGNVDYKSVPALQGVDLSHYRGRAREEVRLTLNS